MGSDSSHDSANGTTSVPEYTRRLRNHINRARPKYHLRKDRGRWLQLGSALDVLEDSALAIDAYAEGDFQARSGELYLAVYGLLQAFVLQQDAAFHLNEVLVDPTQTIDVMLKKYPELDEIRRTRNDSVGHPTKRGRKAPYSYGFISRITLHHTGFELLVTPSGGQTESKEVSIPDLMAKQQRNVEDILALVIAHLEQSEAAHKEEFKAEKLTAVLDSNRDYAVEKMYEGAANSEHAGFGAWGLSHVRDILRTFTEALARRGLELETYGSMKLVFSELEYPLDELEKFYQAAKQQQAPSQALGISTETARIFVFFVATRLAELRQMAAEIDADYSKQEGV